jgi:hypothetical protein
MTVQFSPELLQALQTVVYEKYARETGIIQGMLEVKIDPSIDGEYKLDVTYDDEGTKKFILTTRYVPFGQLHARFELVMKDFFSSIWPKFVLSNGRIKYNDIHSLEVKGHVTKNRERKNHSRFEITNLYGVIVKDKETGLTFTLVEPARTLSEVRDKVVEFLYGEGR